MSVLFVWYVNSNLKVDILLLYLYVIPAEKKRLYTITLGSSHFNDFSNLGICHYVNQYNYGSCFWPQITSV